MSKKNPRRANSTARNALRRHVASQGLPCHICGRPIDYSLPAGHPMSFELDELVPVSRYWLGGYATPQQAALDPSNVAPAHRECNRRRGNRMPQDAKPAEPFPTSGGW